MRNARKIYKRALLLRRGVKFRTKKRCNSRRINLGIEISPHTKKCCNSRRINLGIEINLHTKETLQFKPHKPGDLNKSTHNENVAIQAA